MPEALLRQWMMLRAIPAAPAGIDTAALKERLADQGMSTTQRTIQRDLITLSRIFPLAAEENRRPYRWKWVEGAAVTDIPGMEPPTALTFKLVEQFIPDLLPPSVRDFLAGHFERAEGVLGQVDQHSPFRSWRDRVRVLHKGMSLHAPPVPKDVVRSVYMALLESRQVRAHYRPRESIRDAPREYVINPLGIVLRDGIIYLVCTLWNYADVRQLVLHRMTTAELLDSPAQQLQGFDLEEYIGSGAFDIVQGPPLSLVALFGSAAALHLHETPLSEDQVISDASAGRVRITATVSDTSQLRWWLLSLGDQVEVMEPDHLRQELSDTVHRVAKRYGSV